MSKLNRLFFLSFLILFLFACTKENTPPQADFTMDPGSGNDETIFMFDASISTDDQDDLDDDYEQQILAMYPVFGSINNIQPWQDPDGDGVNNYDEQIAGTEAWVNDLPDSDFDDMDDLWEQQIVDDDPDDAYTI